MNTKKQIIIKNALQLFIEKGVEDTSLQDILNATSISKGTFYNHFSSKDECLAESVDQIHKEIRTELDQKLIGQSRNDKDVLKEQFILHMKLTNDYQLYDLFRVIRQGRDKGLRKMIHRKEVADIQWMSERVVEVFGKEFQDYSREAVILYFGMLQVIISSCKINKKPLNVERIVTVTMRYLEMILQEMLETKRVILNWEAAADTPEGTLLDALKHAHKTAEADDKHLLEALIEEMQRAQPRTAIIQALAKSLSNSWQELKADIEVSTV